MVINNIIVNISSQNNQGLPFCLALKLGSSSSHTAAASAAAAAAAASHLSTLLPLPDRFMDTEHHLSCTGVPESSDLRTKCKGIATAPHEKYQTFSEEASGNVLRRKCSIYTAASRVVKEIHHQLMWKVLMYCLFTKLYPLGVCLIVAKHLS